MKSAFQIGVFNSRLAISLVRGYLSNVKKRDSGFIMPLALLAILIMSLSVALVASRSSYDLLSAIFQSDARKAKEAAEYGYSSIINSLNTNENSYLLVTRFGSWQTVSSSQLSACNLKIPTTAVAANRVPGVSSNTALPSVSLPGDVGVSYSLVSYTPPEPATLPVSGCSSSSSPFGNLFGGRATFVIESIVTRGNVERARYRLTRVAHIKGLIVGQGGDLALIILGPPSGSSFDQTDFLYDSNGDGQVNTATDSPMDVACIACNPNLTQPQLRSALFVGPAGTIGDIQAGSINLGSFPSIPSEISAITPVNISTTQIDYPYTGPSGALASECRNIAVNNIPNAEIACRIGNIDLSTGGSKYMTVRTTNSDGSPKAVNLFVSGSINVSGSRNIRNTDPVNNWSYLRMYGLPASNPNICSQLINMNGANSINGAFSWFPRGRNNNSGGGGAIANYFGVMWICEFNGSGSNVFMAPFNAASAIPGIVGSFGADSPIPLQPYVYRAYGVR